MTKLAPIALFVYNRFGTTKKTVEALKKNYLASQSELFIFSDGGIQTEGKGVFGVKVQGPIFYDSTSTTYYLDPAATGTSLNVAGGATFAGDVTIEKSTPTLTFNNLAGGGLDPILEASGSNFNIKTTSVTPLSINLSTQAATFAGTVKGTTYLVNHTSAAGIGASLGDVNSAELGPGYLSLSRDDTADAKQIVFEKNDVEHSYIQTTTDGLEIKGNGVHFSTDNTFLSNYSYTFRDAVGINNPNATSAATNSNTVMSVGAMSGNAEPTSIITTGVIMKKIK